MTLPHRLDLARRWLREEDRGAIGVLVLLTLLGAGLALAYPLYFTGVVFMVPLLLSEASGAWRIRGGTKAD